MTSALPSTDPLAALVDLPGVLDAADAARDALSAVHRLPANRKGWATTAAEASLRAARASAVLDGARPDLPDSVADVDAILAGALRVGQALEGDALASAIATWTRAPLQALARLHVLAAADLVTDPEQLGRPRTDPGVAERLSSLADLVTGATKAPAPVLAAVVHGELLTLAPFGTADGVIARAASRLVSASTGFDPRNLGVPEVFWMKRAKGYREAAAGYAAGTPGGVGSWLLFALASFEAGAEEAAAIAATAGPS